MNGKIILPIGTGEIVSRILSENGFKETDEEAFEKIKNKKISWKVVTIKVARDFLRNTISENDAVNQLTDKLKIQETTAKKIIADIKRKILPQTEPLVPIKEKISSTKKTNKPATIPPTISSKRQSDQYRESIE